jgi:hypothetical protein
MKLKRIKCTRSIKIFVGDFETIIPEWGEEHVLEDGDDEDACREEVRMKVNQGFRRQVEIELKSLQTRRRKERDDETKLRVQEVWDWIAPPPRDIGATARGEQKRRRRRR